MKKGSYNAEKVCILLAFLCTLHFISVGMRSFRSIDEENTRLASANQSPTITWPLLIQSRRSTPITCDQSNDISDWCYLNRPTTLNPKTATLTALDFHAPPTSLKIRLYPRKWEPSAMSSITEITITTSPLRRFHSSPALVFSAGGYTGNLFHDFNDGLIPLYVTLHALFPPGHDVTLVVTGFTDWWHTKYEAVLPELSKLPVINLDNQTVTHCFPSAAVGLISHGPMTIDLSSMHPSPKTMLDFRALLEKAYSTRNVPNKPPPVQPNRPRMVLVARRGGVGRVILNQEEVVRAAEETGFDVVVFEPDKRTYLVEAYALINGSHAMMGVHGAALTHALFLRAGASLVQVIPLGNDWLAETYFGRLANEGIGLEYVEYKIRVEESSLLEKFGRGDVLLKKPNEIAGRNWTALDTVYLKGQDVRIDMGRFRGYLERAYYKAKRFMDNNG